MESGAIFISVVRIYLDGDFYIRLRSRHRTSSPFIVTYHFKSGGYSAPLDFSTVPNGCEKIFVASRLWQQSPPIAADWLRRRTFFAFGKKEFSTKQPSPTQNKKPTYWSVSVLVGEGGFEPPKLKAADLQSVPFGHSGTLPNIKLAC